MANTGKQVLQRKTPVTWKRPVTDYQADLKTQEAETLYVVSSLKSSIPFHNNKKPIIYDCARNSVRNVESRCFHQVCRITQVRSSPLQVLRSTLDYPRTLLILSPKSPRLPIQPCRPQTCWSKSRVPGIQKSTSPPKNSDTSCSDLPIPRIQWTATPVHCTNHVPRDLKNQSLWCLCLYPNFHTGLNSPSSPRLVSGIYDGTMVGRIGAIGLLRIGRCSCLDLRSARGQFEKR